MTDELDALAFDPMAFLKALRNEPAATVANPVADKILLVRDCRDNRNCRKGENVDIKSLQRELEFLRAQYKACLKVRRSPDHRHFPEAVLQAEAEAFERMERRVREIQITLLS